jgi:vacuolar-type H+-ATPase subunit H
MSSKDLLEGLFDVEREAEDVVESARAEARRRVEAAKAAARGLAEDARASALSAAKEEEASAKSEVDASYAESLKSFKADLSASRLDHDRFAEACRGAIQRLFPR